MLFPDLNENNQDYNFPEYGKQVELNEPWRGYRSATIVAQTQRGFIIKLTSGAELEVYPDEIEFD